MTKGKYIRTFEMKQNQSNSIKLGWKEGRVKGFTGCHHSEESKIKNRLSHLNKEPWNKGIPDYLSKETRKVVTGKIQEKWQDLEYKATIKEIRSKPEYRENMSNSCKKVIKDEEWCKNIAIAMKEKWQEPEYKEQQIKKMMKNSGKHPNKIETFFGMYLWNEFFERCEYTGKGNKVIGGKCPDFVIEDSKKVIELFGDYWHDPIKMAKRAPNKKIQTPQERIDHFKQYGYDCIVIWEKELEDMEKVIRKIRDFLGITGEMLVNQVNVDTFLEE